MNQPRNIVAATILEQQEPMDGERVLARLADWRGRVHRLYDEIERELGEGFTFSRRGKQRSQEGMVQRAGLSESDVPALDILEIESTDGHVRATLQPRDLWIIGANGRIDLTIARQGGGRRMFFLLDLSPPLSEPSDWRIVSLSDRLHQPPFAVSRLRDLLA